MNANLSALNATVCALSFRYLEESHLSLCFPSLSLIAICLNLIIPELIENTLVLNFNCNYLI